MNTLSFLDKVAEVPPLSKGFKPIVGANSLLIRFRNDFGVGPSSFVPTNLAQRSSTAKSRAPDTTRWRSSGRGSSVRPTTSNNNCTNGNTITTANGCTRFSEETLPLIAAATSSPKTPLCEEFEANFNAADERICVER